MSYDLAVWEGERPVSDEAALAAYVEMMKRTEGVDSEPPSDRIRAYVNALLARWPDITTPDGDDSPWADGPLINNASGTGITWRWCGAGPRRPRLIRRQCSC